MSVSLDPSGTGGSGGLTQQEITQRMAGLRNMGIARDVLDSATQLVGLATAGIRGAFNDATAENEYRTQLAAVHEIGGLMTSDAYARATIRVAQQAISNARTAEQYEAAKRLIANLQQNYQQRTTPSSGNAGSGAGGSSETPGWVWPAVIGGVAVLGVGAYFLTQKRANPSTRRRRRR